MLFFNNTLASRPPKGTDPNLIKIVVQFNKGQDQTNNINFFRKQKTGFDKNTAIAPKIIFLLKFEDSEYKEPHHLPSEGLV